MLNHKDTASAAKGPGGGHGGEASAGASERGVEANRGPEGEGEGAVAETGESSTAAAEHRARKGLKGGRADARTRTDGEISFLAAGRRGEEEEQLA